MAVLRQGIATTRRRTLGQTLRLIPTRYLRRIARHRLRKQPHSAAIRRYLHQQIHNPDPVHLRIPHVAVANDPGIPLRRTRRRLQLPAHGIEPSRALLLLAQRHWLRAVRIRFVLAHVHVEGEVAET